MGMGQGQFNPNCHYGHEPGHRIASCPHVKCHQKEKLIIRVAGMLRFLNGNSIISIPGKIMWETVELSAKAGPGTIPASKVTSGTLFYQDQEGDYKVFSQMDAGLSLDAQIVCSLADMQQQYGSEVLEHVVNCIVQESGVQNFH